MCPTKIKRTLQFPLLICFILFSLELFSQNEKGVSRIEKSALVSVGKTYAVIIGISSYQSPKIPQLEYADKDAQALADFLRSPAGGNADSSNIKLLLNENAKCANIWAAIGWLGRVAQKGDKAFIYFSGHGDAIDERESFLLCYDAPGQDPNLYLAGGVIQIYNLKNRIHDLVNGKGAQVLFITDACRTNEIPGGQNGSGYAYKKIMEDNMGEIQFNSCSANETSQEGKQWGNGRGVFSWFLINGMMGLADDDEDGIVTLYELQTYVSSNVRKETKSPSTGKPQQSPAFCCTDKNDISIAVVNKDRKNNSIHEMKVNNTTNAVATKGIISFEDVTTQNTYEGFKNHIQKKELFVLRGECAFNDLNFLRNCMYVSEDQKYELIDIYVAAVMNNVQEDLNTLLDGKFGMKIANSDEIQSVLELVELPEEETATIRGNYYFFKGWEYYNNSSDELLNKALRYCDSAIHILPNAAYIYDVQGLVYQRQKNYSAAEKSFNVAIKLAPNWTFAIGNLANNFFKNGNDSNALILYDRVVKLDSTLAIAYNNIGVIYFGKWRRSVIENERIIGIRNLEKAIFLDSTNIDAFFNISLFYVDDTVGVKRIYYLQKAYQLDPTRTDVLSNLAQCYFNKSDFTQAANYNKQWYEQSNESVAEFSWALSVYRNHDYENAIVIFKNYSFKNQNDSDGYYFVGLNYFRLANTDSALFYFKAQEKINPNRINLKYYMGKTYVLMGENKKAIHCFKVDAKTHPEDKMYPYFELSNIYSKRFLGKHKSKKYKAKYDKLNGK